MTRLAMSLVFLHGICAGCSRNEAAERPLAPQPIHFDHRVHHEEEMECTDCHTGAETGPRATLPTTRACMLCHDEAQGEHPDEPKIREYFERREPIPWVQVDRLPHNVVFSHAIHVGDAAMSCAECHGAVEAQSEPVTASRTTHLTKDQCLQCHEERDVPRNCMSCHR